MLERRRLLRVQRRVVAITTSETRACQQLEEDPALPRFAEFLAEIHALASGGDCSIEVSATQVGVSATGQGTERRASQMHRPGKREGFVPECRSIGRLALDPRDRGEE